MIGVISCRLFSTPATDPKPRDMVLGSQQAICKATATTLRGIADDSHKANGASRPVNCRVRPAKSRRKDMVKTRR